MATYVLTKVRRYGGNPPKYGQIMFAIIVMSLAYNISEKSGFFISLLAWIVILGCIAFIIFDFIAIQDLDRKIKEEKEQKDKSNIERQNIRTRIEKLRNDEGGDDSIQKIRDSLYSNQGMSDDEIASMNKLHNEYNDISKATNNLKEQNKKLRSDNLSDERKLRQSNKKVQNLKLDNLKAEIITELQYFQKLTKINNLKKVSQWVVSGSFENLSHEDNLRKRKLRLSIMNLEQIIKFK